MSQRLALACRCWWALTAMSAACAQSDDRAAGEFSWPASAYELVPSGQIFAASYSSGSPADSYLRLSLHPYGAERACIEYGADAISDGVFLRVETNAYRVGKFAVVPRRTEEADSLQAEVSLIDSQGGVKRHRFAATGGELDVAEITAGGVRGVLRAEFASDPLQEAECTSGAGKDGSTYAVCSCQTLHGDSFTCEPMAPGTSCCAPRGPSDVSVTFELAALPCRELCVVNDPLAWHLCVDPGHTLNEVR